MMLDTVCNVHQYIDVNNNQIWVNLNGVYKINEITQDINGHRLINKSVLPIYEFIPKKLITTNYRDNETNRLYSKEEKQKLFNQLLQDTNTYWNDCEDKYIFDTLENEYKFKNGCLWFDELIHENIYSDETWNIVNLECIGTFYFPKNKYLVNHYEIRGTGYRNSNIYSIDKYKFIIDLFNLYENTYDVKFLDITPNLEFVKYKLYDESEKYLFLSTKYNYYINSNIYNTIEKAEEAFTQWKNDIEKYIFITLFGKEIELTPNTYRLVEDSLTTILDSLKNINVYKKDYTAKESLIKYINNTIHKINNDVTNNNPKMLTIEDIL